MSWPKPVDYNWRGQRLQCAHVGQQVTLKPFGPNSPARCTGTINMIDEENERVALTDGYKSVIMSFTDWQWMQVSPHLEKT